VEAFTLGCRTRHWLLRLDCPDAIKKCKQLYDSAYCKTNTMPANEDTVDPTPLSPGKRNLVPIDRYLASQLNVEQAIICCYYPHLNVYYFPTGTHLRNSLITFQLHNNPQEHICYGSIQLIYWDEGKGWKFAIQQQLPKPPQCQNGVYDVFAQFANYPAEMYLIELSDKVDVIEVDEILGHYARWD
jgi:hypothetical protein